MAAQYITEAEATMKMIGKSTVPGAHLVDFLPFRTPSPRLPHDRSRR